MSRILLASLSAELEDRITRATGGRLQVLRFDQLPENPTALLSRLSEVALPDVLVLDAVDDPDPALRLAAAFADQLPRIAVVLAARDIERIALPALRAGVREVIDPATDLQHIGASLERVSPTPQLQPVSAVTPLPRKGRIITVVSPKGGVGKTTVATNIAVGLAQRDPNATVLVDLDIQFGDVASSLDLEPEYFLADAVSAPAQHDAMVLKTFLTRHSTGLHVICAPDSPVDADSITADQIARLLTMLAAEFRYVVVDTAPGLSEHTLSVLDHSTDLVLLTSMEVPGIRGLRKELDTLTELELLPGSRTVVLNFTESNGLLTVADVEAVIGTAVDLELPRSKAAGTAANQGVPLLQSGVRDPLTKALRKLIELLVAEDGPALTGTAAPARQPASDSSDKRSKARHAARRWRRTRMTA